jgi:hypothetical protein
MIGTYHVEEIKPGDIISLEIKNIKHWAIVILTEYPEEGWCLVSPTTTSYKLSKKKLRFTADIFPPSKDPDSHITLQFQTLRTGNAKANWCGRIEDRAFIRTIVNAHFSELNNIRNEINKQLK